LNALGLALVVGGFLAGSIPFGLVLARALLGVDVRTVGSGNIGATNVARAGGKKLGVVVLLLDAAKAVVPMLVARALLGAGPHGDAWVVATGAAAFLGHVYTPWLGFQGGKGVATGLGVFAVLAPWAAIGGVVAYALVYAATRISSLGSLTGTLVCTAGTFVAYGARSAVPWVGLLLAAVIIARHRENLQRLLQGAEKKV
jgi:acyl phosphate:glycerol-3-phosphate acyltransferase